ncbi:MAG: hypothetical protein DRI36_03050 [Caldiserica bacterium]|nr:MAG: hypothetical protein DRI36_03050 [Caldisericota bacterium]
MSRVDTNVIINSFQSLPKKEKKKIIDKLLEDERLREDVIDIVKSLLREKERSIPYSKVRGELKRAGKL